MVFRGRCQRDFTCLKDNGHSGDCEFPKRSTPKELEAAKLQIGGDHYKGKSLQPWDVWEAFDLDPWEANAVKYLLRWRSKNGVEDLKKAAHYIQYLIEREENRSV